MIDPRLLWLAALVASAALTVWGCRRAFAAATDSPPRLTGPPNGAVVRYLLVAVVGVLLTLTSCFPLEAHRPPGSGPYEPVDSNDMPLDGEP
jgi:hypothetical protein